MLVLRAAMMALRVETQHLVRLPRPMVVGAVAVGKGLLLILLVDAVVASALKVRTHTTQVLMALAAAATAALLLESVL